MKHKYTEWLAEADRYLESNADLPEPPEPLTTQQTLDLINACVAAWSLLGNIGTGKWAKTPAGDKLRKALGIDE